MRMEDLINIEELAKNLAVRFNLETNKIIFDEVYEIIYPIDHYLPVLKLIKTSPSSYNIHFNIETSVTEALEILQFLDETTTVPYNVEDHYYLSPVTNAVYYGDEASLHRRDDFKEVIERDLRTIIELENIEKNPDEIEYALEGEVSYILDTPIGPADYSDYLEYLSSRKKGKKLTH